MLAILWATRKRHNSSKEWCPFLAERSVKAKRITRDSAKRSKAPTVGAVAAGRGHCDDGVSPDDA